MIGAARHRRAAVARATLAASAAALAYATPGLAQLGAGIEGRAISNRTALDLPEFRDAPGDPFELPPARTLDEEDDDGRLATAPSFELHEVRVSGASIVPPRRIEAIASAYVERPITTMQVARLRDEITALYLEEGYITSGAVVPDQDVSDGVLDVEVVEGRLDGVRVTGVHALRPAYIRSRIAPKTGVIVSRRELQRRFQLLLADPNIDRVNVQLVPSGDAGEALLNVEVEEADRFLLEVEAASDRSPSVGGERLIVRSSLRNLLGVGDRYSIEGGATEGLLDVQGSFFTPLNARDLALSLQASATDAEVVEDPLNALDIVSSSFSYSGGLSMPVWRGFAGSLTLSAEAGHTWTKTRLLDAPFSFSAGAVNGKTQLSYARLGQDLVLQSERQAFAARSVFSLGLDALEDPNATNPLIPPTDWLAWSGQAQYALRVTNSGQQLIARLESQLTDDKLFAVEQITIGGMDSVRGYRKNEVLADNGAVGAIEYRVPVNDLGFPRLGRATGLDALLGVFVDGGYGWNAEGPDPQTDRLASAGMSLLWRVNDRVTASGYWAAQLEPVPDRTDEGVQDLGLGFRLTSRLN